MALIGGLGCSLYWPLLFFITVHNHTKMRKILFILILCAGCAKEQDQPRNPRHDVCLEVTSDRPVTISGYMGKTQINKAQCVYLNSGDSALIKIHAQDSALITIRLYKNGNLVAYKANHCYYKTYQLTQKF